MRLSVNVPATIAAVLFLIAFLGDVHALTVNVDTWRDIGLVFLALTGLVVFNRGS